MVSEVFRVFLEELSSSRSLPPDLNAAALEVLPPVFEPQGGSALDPLRSGALEFEERQRFVAAAPLVQLETQAPLLESLNHLQRVLEHSGSNWVRPGRYAPFKVLRLSALEVRILRERFPGLLLQRERRYAPIPLRHPLLERFRTLALPAGPSRTLTLRVVGGSGEGLPEVEVSLLTARGEGGQGGGYRARTDASGVARLELPTGLRTARTLILEPPRGHWSRVIHTPTLEDATLALIPLAPGGLGAGHRLLGASQGQPGRGGGVRVGVVDSGIAEHPALRVAGGQCFVSGYAPERWRDEDGHGTHCAGIIAGQWGAGMAWGHAPDCELHALRVFGLPGEGGYTSDIADALDYAVEQELDLLNLSLGMSGEDAFLSSRLGAAARAGTVCVVAAGNEGGAVSFPARHPLTVAVSALGVRGSYPADSLSGQFSESEQVSTAQPEVYLARFSNRGPELYACAPGVAIVSSVLEGGYAPMDGTSMACPQITGWLAALLSQRPELLGAARTLERHSQILAALQEHCVRLGLGRDLEGWGLPRWKVQP